MKRIIEFQVLDEKYSFKENDVSIFEIEKTTKICKNCVFLTEKCKKSIKNAHLDTKKKK